jgi:dipeptidyl aminopeptidase/acylaminoacyl peptidase
MIRVIVRSVVLLATLVATGSPNVVSAPLAVPKGRSWTIPDIVEVCRITGVAIRGATHVTAYVLKQPSIADGENHYELYVVDPAHQGVPRKLLAAIFIGNLSWHPATSNWTVRADLGTGVQLYDVTDEGRVTQILPSLQTVVVGGSEGLVLSAAEGPRAIGVIAYGWAPDGRQLWYSRFRLRADSEQQEMLDQGVRHDDLKMLGTSVRDVERVVRLLGTELHVVDKQSGSDRVIRFVESDVHGDFVVFRSNAGATVWIDPRHIQYRLLDVASGRRRLSLWRTDVVNGETVELKIDSEDEIFNSVPTKEGILTVRSVNGKPRRLVDIGLDGHVLADYGPVASSDIGGSDGVWRDQARDRWVFAAGFIDHGGLFIDHGGLMRFPARSKSDALGNIAGHLSACAFNLDLSFGACSRESIGLAPELVSVSPVTGKAEILDRPNARYDQIEPLRTVPGHWVNRFGYQNTGYITYPRHYVSGNKYPAIVVTHGFDARNEFLQDALQWEFPIQVFAERGYFVLSVNEPLRHSDDPNTHIPTELQSGMAQAQFIEAYNPLASMEAAAGALVGSGDVQPSEIGIAGYSRGSDMTRFAISHSSVFSVASSANSSWWDASTYWAGSEFLRTIYKGLLGGSPFDPKAYPNYLEFSPSARARDFAGPLLQQFSVVESTYALELDQLLKDSRIPTELFLFPSEAHVFWNPRHRAAAMAQNLEWFDYWLLGRRDPDMKKVQQYARWDEMAAQWRLVIDQRKHDPGVSSGPSPTGR